MRKKQGEYLSKIDILTKENRALKADKKDMAKNYNKEIVATKIQRVAAMKNNNDKYLNDMTRINVSFFDATSGLEPEVVEMVNLKIEDIR